MNTKNDTAVGTQTPLKRLSSSLTPSEQVAWSLALLLFGVGDIATTRVGMSIGLVEANHAAGLMMGSFGFWPSVLGGKGLILGLIAVQHYAYKRMGYGWAGQLLVWYMVLLGSLLTVWNSWLIYSVL